MTIPKNGIGDYTEDLREEHLKKKKTEDVEVDNTNTNLERKVFCVSIKI